MSSRREPNEASSSKSKGKAVDPSEHPNIPDGGGYADEADKDEDKGDMGLNEEENAVRPLNPATSSKAKKAFGMHRVQPTAKKGNDPSNYEDRFPEDPMYQETMPNARVWMTHQAESAIHDANMVEEIRDNVDVLLVFAGLFSAVVTTFVVQTSQSLQADYAQVSASLLFELVLVQRSIANGSPVDPIPVSSLNPQTAFVPAATDVWVNGLWFSSLFLSLTTALVAVLVKQWLHHYVVLPSGTPRERCCVRQYRYLGFQKWRVEVIVGLLPVLMHLALALFFIGLSLFLHPLRAALSCVIWTGTVLLIATYAIVTILSMCFPQCPYRTPLCDLAYPLYFYVTSLVQQHYYRLCQLLQRFPYRTQLYNLAYRPYIYGASLVQKHYHRLHQLLQCWHEKKVESVNDITAKPNSLKQLELGAVEKASLRLSVEALQWLLSASSNPTVQSIVMESIGGLPMGALAEVEDVFHDSPSLVDVQRNLLMSLADERGMGIWISFPTLSMSSGMNRKLERLLRSCMFISRIEKLWPFINIPDQLDRNEFGATLVAQLPKLCRHMHPRVSMLWEPNVFLHDILSLETPARFPPIVWKNLIQLATASWDPKLFNVDDKFPRLLCSAVIESDILYTDIRPKQQLFASPLVVDFQHAVGYFSEIALKYMMCWLSWFDRLPGERLECRVLVASTRFMIQRVSRLNAGRDEILLLEDFINECICSQMLNTEAIWNILESVIVVTPIFSQYRIDLQNDSCPGIVLAHYRTFVQQRNLASHIHASSSAFDLLVTFTTTQWSTLDTSIRTRDVFEFLEECLQHCFRPAYDVFHQQRCLKFLTMQPVSSWSTSLLKAYVIGITVAIHPSSGDPEENETILQAIDCLHESENLFLVCSVLAMYPHTREWVFAAAGIHDIMTTLARIRPLDPAWGNCRQKLRELAEDESFFSRSEGEDSESEEELEMEAIIRKQEMEECRCNLHAAIEKLDIFFSNIPPQATGGSELPGPMPQPQSWLDRLGRLLPWCRPRQHDEEHKLTEVV